MSRDAVQCFFVRLPEGPGAHRGDGSEGLLHLPQLARRCRSLGRASAQRFSLRCDWRNPHQIPGSQKPNWFVARKFPGPTPKTRSHDQPRLISLLVHQSPVQFPDVARANVIFVRLTLSDDFLPSFTKTISTPSSPQALPVSLTS